MVGRAGRLRGPGSGKVKMMRLQQVSELCAVIIFDFGAIRTDVRILGIWGGVRGRVIPRV